MSEVGATMGPVQEAPFQRIIVLDAPTAHASVELTTKTEYKLLTVGELAERSSQPAPSQRNMVPTPPATVPTAQPLVGELRKTLRSSFAGAREVNTDQAPVGHTPDHLRILAGPALLPTAQPSNPPGRMKTENRSVTDPTGTVAAVHEIPSQ
jgi:hypothetical protein